MRGAGRRWVRAACTDNAECASGYCYADVDGGSVGARSCHAECMESFAARFSCDSAKDCCQSFDWCKPLQVGHPPACWWEG